MRSRDVLGKRIVRVDQYRMRSNGGRTHWALARIVLDDGTVIFPTTIEPDLKDWTEYGTQMSAVKPEPP
jgi:hypothetical protein